jgi:RNA polymerase sigma-70 factor (ECF subfamily)
MNEKIYPTNLPMQTFESMHLKLKGAIVQYVFYLTGKSQDSEDVAQEIFIKLWINWERVKEMRDDELKNYVFIAIRNHFINERRENSRCTRNKKMFLEAYSQVYTGYYWHDDMLVSEGLALHRKAVAKLATKERIVYLYHQNDYSSGEIARMLNRSYNTVQNQLSAAYKKVKMYLNNNYDWNLCESGRRNCSRQAALN